MDVKACSRPLRPGLDPARDQCRAGRSFEHDRRAAPESRHHQAFGRSPPHPASTQQIRELREQGLTWNEVAKQVDMTVPVPGALAGAWAVELSQSAASPARSSRTARHRCSNVSWPRLAWLRFSTTPLCRVRRRRQARRSRLPVRGNSARHRGVRDRLPDRKRLGRSGGSGCRPDRALDQPGSGPRRVRPSRLRQRAPTPRGALSEPRDRESNLDPTPRRGGITIRFANRRGAMTC